MKSPSCVRLFATPWTVAHQAPPSMEFSRREYWSGLPVPSPGDLPDSGIKPWPLLSQADALPSEPPGNNQVTQLLLSDKINSVSGSWTRVFCAFLRPLCLLRHLLFCDIYLLLGLRFLRLVQIFSMWCMCVLVASVVSDFLRPHVAHQAPPSMGFSRQECWSGLPRSSPKDLPNPGIELVSQSPALPGRFFTASVTWKAPLKAVAA